MGDVARLLGRIFLGLGFGFSAIDLLTSSSKQQTNGLDRTNGAGQSNGVGRAPARRSLAGNGLAAPVGQTYDVGPLRERVRLMHRLIKGTPPRGTPGTAGYSSGTGHFSVKLNEVTKEILAEKIGGRYKVPEKDCLAEVKQLFHAIRNPRSKWSVRYTRDMLLADTFSTADRTVIKTKAGDCDDFTVLIGAMLMTVGHPVAIRVIHTRDKSSWNHVYLITPARFDDPQAPWVAVDGSMQKPLGWEAPGVREVAAYQRQHGKPPPKPIGVTVRVADFPVT